MLVSDLSRDKFTAFGNLSEVGRIASLHKFDLINASILAETEATNPVLASSFSKRPDVDFDQLSWKCHRDYTRCMLCMRCSDVHQSASHG